MFPDPNIDDPLFISAEHGDGFQDLYAKIRDNIPADKFKSYEDRKDKRIGRYFELKDQLLDELIQFKMDLVAEEKSDGEVSEDDLH